jgi:hypothetical protein
MIEEQNIKIDQFDEKNGILGMDRDLYLSIIQFLNTKVLRNYIGLSEETLCRSNHLHYHIYRWKRMTKLL